MAVITGLDNLLRNQVKRIAGRTVGVVAHPASVTGNLTPILDAFESAGVRVGAIFGPEHGFGGAAQDMEAVTDRVSFHGRPPVFSLYGATDASLSPDPEVVARMDALVVDLQDVGARYYTYVWTAVLCLRVCKQVGTELIVLDRPNPLGGVAVEGSPQTAACCSFVGLFPLSNRHGLTIGEILQMVAAADGAADVLTVVPMVGWHRDMMFETTGLPFVPPSPNMPTLDTARVYPGACLLEATAFSEGRGTTCPFLCFGAPHVDETALCRYLNALALPGVRFRPTVFKPMFHKHANTTCRGGYIHITDNQSFMPYRTGVAVLLALYRQNRNAFEWRRDPYEFVHDRPAVDLLTGSSTIRSLLESGATLDDMVDSWQTGEREFAEMKPHFHLY